MAGIVCPLLNVGAAGRAGKTYLEGGESVIGLWVALGGGLGALAGALPAATARPEHRAFLLIGLCGGFTTFSTFDFETFALVADARYATAAAYSLGSVVGGVLGARGGGEDPAGRRGVSPGARTPRQAASSDTRSVRTRNR
jgi:hypothetical protein